MPRRGYVSRRVVASDPVFGDVLVAKMIHAVMLQGKARVAERLVYGSLEILKEKTKEDPVAVLK
ncbi:MAG: 30S ribosomal protein S7, partial [Deltaproteobacteria bacterium]|nr:30S ribosomal protein S7 [Deltaproteobacteria bacterium]